MAKKIVVIGTGYVGLPLAIMLARSGYEVIGIDIEENVVNAINEGVLHLAEEEVKQDDYFYKEHRYGAFHRTITLPGGLNTDEAEAAFEDGVLKLTLPKSEAIKPKQIKVKGKTESAAK